jgi:hypothetical protein
MVKPFGTLEVMCFSSAVIIKMFSGMRNSVIWYGGYKLIRESICLNFHEKGCGRKFL